MQTRRQNLKAPLKKTYELDDTPEEDNCSYDDKENAPTNSGRGSKRKGDDKSRSSRRDNKGLSKRQKTGDAASASQESPPIFAFKTAKTSFRKRKTLKLQKQREDEEKNKKRIDDLVAYFKNLDEQKLETA